jgi:hypothetical protein
MRAAVVLALAGLAACTPQAQDRLAREAARSTVTRVVVDRFPGVPVEPAIDCVIDNATAAEIASLAADAALGPTQSTAEVVTRILTRPETINCLGARGLPALLRQPARA